MNPIRFGSVTKRHRHRLPIVETLEAGDVVTRVYACGCAVDDVARLRGRRSAKRGKSIQRQRIVGLGGRNLAGNAENLDGLGTMFAYESKSGGSFPERAWRWLRGIPHDSGQTPVLIITDTPGPGRKARSVVIVDYDDWRELHGE